MIVYSENKLKRVYKTPSIRLLSTDLERSFLNSSTKPVIEERCYVVFWIPTSFADPCFEIPRTTQVEKNISDVPEVEFYIKVELIDEKDFTVSVRKNNEYQKVVVLHREQVGPVSLIEFSYECFTQGEEGFQFTATKFPEAVYQIIYGIYNRLPNYSVGETPSFPPYVSNRRVDLFAKDNEAILYYLKQYSFIVSRTVMFLQIAIRRVSEKHQELEQEERSLLDELCNHARLLELSMGSMMNSQYNTVCRTDSKDDEGAQIAWTIENGMYYVRFLEQEFANLRQGQFVAFMVDNARESLESANKSITLANKSITLGWASVVIGLLSVLTAFLIAHNSSSELQSVRKALEKDLSTIPSSLSRITSKMDSLSRGNANEDTLFFEKSEMMELVTSQERQQ